MVQECTNWMQTILYYRQDSVTPKNRKNISTSISTLLLNQWYHFTLSLLIFHEKYLINYSATQSSSILLFTIQCHLVVVGELITRQRYIRRKLVLVDGTFFYINSTCQKQNIKSLITRKCKLFQPRALSAIGLLKLNRGLKLPLHYLQTVIEVL